MIKWYTLKEAATEACRLKKPINQHQLLREVTYGDLANRGPHEISLKHTPRGKGTPIWHISETCLLEYLEEDYKVRVETKRLVKESAAPPKTTPATGLSKEAKDTGEVRRKLEDRLEELRLMRLLENEYEYPA